VEKPAADSGELTGDPELFAAKVYAIPGQAEDFPAAQAQDEDEYIGRIEGVVDLS
jgi:hypothetical protein